MDGIYRGAETSLLALALALGLAAAMLAQGPVGRQSILESGAELAVTLPMIEVFADEAP